MQQKIIDIALHEVSKKTGNRMSIGDIRLRPFNSLHLDNVYAADLQGDTLLYVEHLSAGFRLWPLLRSRLVISSAELDNFTVNLKRDSIGAPFNFQFFIDAFASADTTDTTSGKFTVEIDDIRLTRGRFSYDVLSATVKDSVFDANHIHANGLDAHIRLTSINLKKLDVAVEHLSFTERSGFVLESLSAGITSIGERMMLKDLEVQLPHSSLKIPSAMVDYTGMGLSHLADSAQYNLSLDIPRFRLDDLKAFAPVLSRFTESIVLRGGFSGRFPAVGVDSLAVSYGNNLRLKLRASLGDYTYWDTAPVDLHIADLVIKPQGIAEIYALSGSTLPVHTDGIRLSASVAGALPNAKIRLSAISSPSGRLDITGAGGYVFRTGETHFDLKTSANEFDIKALLNGHPEFGLVSFSLNAAGSIDKAGHIDAEAGMEIDRFDFHQYAYRDITAEASYKGKHATLMLHSRDRYAPLLLRAEAELTDTPSAKLYLKTEHLMPDKTKLTPGYKESDLTAVLTAEVHGFDPEHMKAAVVLDSTHFSVMDKEASLETIRLNYEATTGRKKSLRFDSKLITVGLTGHFGLNTIAQSLHHTMSVYFPKFVEPETIRNTADDSLRINISIRNTEKWAQLLASPFAITDTAKLTVTYCGRNDHITVKADLPETKLEGMVLKGSRLSLHADTINRTLHLDAGTVRFGVADTMHLDLAAKTSADSLHIGTQFDIVMPKISAGGKLGLAANFTKVPGQKLPDMVVDIYPTALRFNNQELHIKKSRLSMAGGVYAADGFEIILSDTEYLRIAGRISRDEHDTLQISLGKVQIETLMNAVGAGMNLTGEINGKIVASQLLSIPRIITDGFSIKDITFEKQLIGTLDLTSGWNQRINAIQAHATLSRPGARTSVIRGIIFPQSDSLAIDTDIRDIQLSWITPFTKGLLYNVKGALGARVRVEGRPSSLAISGMIRLDDANVGVSMLNTQYRISDSIQIQPDRVVLKNFRIRDEKDQYAVMDGELLHTRFSNFRPSVSMKLQDFLLLNNPNRTDSLFYGTLRMSGSVDVSGSQADMLAKVSLKNSPDSKVSINLPADRASEARLYKSVTFVNKDTTIQLSGTSPGQTLEETMPKLPLRLQMALEVTPGLQLSAVYNPKTKDAATVKGEGNIDFSYNMADSKMNLLGEYKVSEGKATISLRNITSREFTIQPGGVMRFKGDPKASEFDITAVYKLRADLTSLDPTVFGDVSRKRVNTECHIRVSGSIEKMTIGYAIIFPDEDESIQRKANALMATDEIKLKEIAYLLVGSTFYPVANTDPAKPMGSNIWTTLASSAATTLLNSILDGVLSDNWSVGTEMYSDDGEADNMEFDVIISTNLLNNRLTVTSNIGYKNSATNTTNNTNFTGDFDVQYKLTKSGNVVVKVYNVTNDEYYEQAQAQTTQGAGIMYRREAKRFWDLFKRIKK